MKNKMFDIDGMVKDVFGMFLSILIFGAILGVILIYFIAGHSVDRIFSELKVGCENNIVTYYYKGETGPALANSETNKYMKCEELK